MMTVTPYLQSLNDKGLLDIAAFYSSNISTGGQAKNDTELLELGTKLYRFGDIKKQIPACTSCQPRASLLNYYHHHTPSDMRCMLVFAF